MTFHFDLDYILFLKLPFFLTLFFWTIKVHQPFKTFNFSFLTVRNGLQLKAEVVLLPRK